MSLVKVFSGRKLESSVWEYFIYEEKDDKSRCTCTVRDDKGEQCCFRIAGEYKPIITVLRQNGAGQNGADITAIFRR